MAITQMESRQARLIGITAVAVPALIVFTAGCFHSFATGLCAAFGWLGVYYAWNIGIVGQQEWQCVERLGQFYEVKRQGLQLYCMRGVVDVVKVSGSLLERKQPIFKDNATAGGKNEELDFTDGSAPIEAFMWYKNGRTNGTPDEIEADILAYVYANEKPEARAIEIAEDRLRPKFQILDINTASTTRGDVVNGVKDDIGRELGEYGLFFGERTSPIVIADIGLSATQQKLREEMLRGTTTANQIAAEASGYRRAIEEIMYARDANGNRGEQVCDHETAVRIWENQQTRGVLEKTGSNVTIVGNSAEAVVAALARNLK